MSSTTAIVWDWDDTCWATTHQREYSRVLVLSPALLQCWAASVILTGHTREQPRVAIWTNASSQWLELCLHQMADYGAFVSHHAIPVVSARPHGRDVNETTSYDWKRWQAHSLWERLGRPTRWISVGDGVAEYRAGAMLSQYTGVSVQHMIFKVRPTRAELFAQHTILQQRWRDWVVGGGGGGGDSSCINLEDYLDYDPQLRHPSSMVQTAAAVGDWVMVDDDTFLSSVV